MVSEEIQGRVTRKVCLACSKEFTGVVTACPHDGTILIPLQQDQLIGTKLADRYQILSVIGHGGMGVVYKARHELMEREVAIKILKADLITDSMSVKRFQQEARAACKLKHPNVITLFDFGVSPATGQPYLVMDYLKGISLADVIKKDGHIGVDRTVRIFLQACRALEHAHNQGVIHRDLKPGNIMLTETDDEKDFVKVVDFGVAKLIGPGAEEEAQRLTQTGEVCGSPVYMSPEQCMGQTLDPRSDIYSMGVVIYETLTGKLPILGKTMVDTMSKHISEMAPSFNTVRPDLYIPERVEGVVFKALAKDPGERQQSMAELERELEWAVPKPGKSDALRRSIQPGTDFKLPPRSTVTAQSQEIKVPIPTKAPAKAEKKPVGVIVAIVVAALVAAGGGIALMLMNRPEPAPPAVAPAPATTPPAATTPAPAATTAPGTATVPASTTAPGTTTVPSATRAPAATTMPVTPPQRPSTKPAASPSRTTSSITPDSQLSPASNLPSVKPRPRPARIAKPSVKPTVSRPPRGSPSGAARAPAPAKPAGDPFESLRHSRSY